MKIEDARAFKTIYYPSVRKKEVDEEINKMLSNGWRLLSINENPNNSAYMYFVHKKTITELEENGKD